MALEQLMAMTAVWQRASNHLVWVSPGRNLSALAALLDDQRWWKQFDFGQAESYMCDVALCFLGGSGGMHAQESVNCIACKTGSGWPLMVASYSSMTIANMPITINSLTHVPSNYHYP